MSIIMYMYTTHVYHYNPRSQWLVLPSHPSLGFRLQTVVALSGALLGGISQVTPLDLPSVVEDPLYKGVRVDMRVSMKGSVYSCCSVRL